GPDLLLVDFPQAAVLLPERPVLASVVFTHNVEAEILERQASHSSGLWRSVWASQARKMRNYEARILPNYDSVIAVSERDANILREEYGLTSVNTIDTGVDIDYYSFSPPSALPKPFSGGTVVFVGS